MDNKALIIVIGFLGAFLIGAFVAITLLVPGDKTAAYAGLGALAALFIPQIMTLKSSADNAVRLEKVDAKLQETQSELVANTVVTQHTAEVAQAAVELGAANNDALVAHGEKLDTIAGDVDGKLKELMNANVEKARLIGRQEAREQHGHQ